MYRIKLNTKVYLPELTVATVGNFDGLHLGHQQLIAQVNNIAKQYNYRRILITFEPLPSDFFRDKNGMSRQGRLTLLRDKYLFLQKSDLIDELIILHFCDKFANIPAIDFINDILISKLNIQHLVLGRDFRFGKGATGNVEVLRQSELDVSIVEDYTVDNIRVSSSNIRAYAAANNLVKVRQYLGRPITYTGRVIHGYAMGRQYGVPTINLSLGKNKPALWGIFTAYVYIDEIQYEAVVSIGKNPTTVYNGGYKLEAHLLGVDLDLYGKIATIEVLEFLRPELKFNDLDSLFKQIHADIANTISYFSNLKSENIG